MCALTWNETNCTLVTSPPPSSRQVKTVIFDKTGTLTHGRPEVTRVLLLVPKETCPQQLFTAIVGLAESNSEHPLGMAVTNFAKKVRASITVQRSILVSPNPIQPVSRTVQRL